MASLKEMVSYMDSELRMAEIPDYPGAMNGLQLENSGSVEKVAAAVDASLPVIEKAIESGANLLIVHHGMFWQGAQPLTKAFYRKIKLAMNADLAIYSAHLPLDVHPEMGNNILLMRALGFEPDGTFLESKGIPIGLTATVSQTRSELHRLLEKALAGSVHVCPGGTGDISRLGLVTGGAGSEVAICEAAGLDAFITGEGPHWSYPLAEELGIDVFYGGHYATETFGVRALVERLRENFSTESCFVDHPTGL